MPADVPPEQPPDPRIAVHAALADPIRLAVVDALALSDRTPSELGRALDVASNLLAHHLEVLDSAGLLERTVSHGDRRRRYLRLRTQPLTTLLVPPRLVASDVVFVCTHNSARSQLAAALWNRASGVRATSAGTDPAPRVHPRAVRAAARKGIDLAAAAPTSFRPPDVDGHLVVTVCDTAHEELDPQLGRSPLPVLHWSIPDPAAVGTDAAFDAAAADLTARVAALAPLVDAA